MIQIMLVAKDVKHALAMRAELISAGVSTTEIASAVSRINSAQHSVSSLDKRNGPNVAKLCEAIGCSQWRVSSQMVSLFRLEGTKEQMAAQFLAYVQSGEAFRVGTKWQRKGATSAPVEIPPDDGEDTF